MSNKITEETARQIKTDLQAGMKSRDVAEKYGVSKNIADNIKYGTAWAWLTV